MRLPDSRRTSALQDTVNRGVVTSRLPAAASDEQPRGGALDIGPFLLVRGIPRLQRSECLLPVLQLLGGAVRIELLGPVRFLDEDSDPVVAHLGETFSRRVPVCGPAGDVDQLAGREGGGQRRMPRPAAERALDAGAAAGV